MLGKPSRRAAARLQGRGSTAAAEVLEITGAPLEINHRGSLRDANAMEWAQRVRLRVEPAGEPWFELECRLRFPFNSPPRVGGRIAVRYDPGDHDTIAWSDEVPTGTGPRPAAGAPMDDQERAMARALQAEGLSLDAIIARIAADRAEATPAEDA